MSEFTVLKPEDADKTLGDLMDKAKAGDAKSALMAEVIVYTEGLTSTILSAAKAYVRMNPPPHIAGDILMGGVLASLVFDIETRAAPGVVKELRALLDRMDEDPVLLAKRQEAAAKLDAVRKAVDKALAAGHSASEIKSIVDAFYDEDRATRQ